MRIVHQVKNVIIYECDTDQELIKTIGDQMIALINSHDHGSIAISPWNTPVSLFTYLIDNYKNNKTCYKHISFYMIDEVACTNHNEHKNNFQTFLNTKFFDLINVKNKNIHSPLDYSEDYEYSRYDRVIWQANSLDLLVISIDSNGELNFLNQDTNVNSLTHVLKISDERTKNRFVSEFNYDKDHIPEYVISMGLRSILNAKRIIVIAKGKKKAQVIKKLKEGKIIDKYTCTQLLNHRDVSVYVDKDASSLL